MPGIVADTKCLPTPFAYAQNSRVSSKTFPLSLLLCFSLLATAWQSDFDQQIPPELRQKAARKTARTVTCFQSFASTATMLDIAKKCGVPDERRGSGIGIFVYRLRDGSSVNIGTPDMNHLFYMNHVTTTGSKSLFKRQAVARKKAPAKRRTP